MATDYDAPRKTEEELNEDSIEELKTRRNDKNSGKVDEDEAEAAEAFELPGADLSHEELTVRVLPRQSDEFTCAGCFLVRHRSQIAEERTERRRLLLRLRRLTAATAQAEPSSSELRYSASDSTVPALLVGAGRAASRSAAAWPSAFYLGFGLGDRASASVAAGRRDGRPVRRPPIVDHRGR